MPTLEEIKNKVIEVWRSDHIILPSVTAAQFILESASGTSPLAKATNNLFGIKASAPWSGEVYEITSNEEINGISDPQVSKFRKYPTWEASVKDHSDFFTSTAFRKTHYASVIGETDYKTVCNALAKTYATDSAYGTKLIAIIEANGLDAWDEMEGETNMNYEIDYRIINYSGRRTTANKYVIAHESGNPNNVGPNSLEGEVKYMQGQAAQGGAFTSHWVGSGGKIVQIAPVGYIQYGAGGIANPLSYAQVELARTNNADTFKKDYAAYVWLLRMLAAECGIPQTLDKTGNGIKTHLWVTNNLGNTDHTDPYAYLNSWGISNAQFATDIANGLGTPTVTVTAAEVVTAGPVRNPVSYNAVVTSGGYSVDSKPWGEDGAENWGQTDNILGNSIYVYEENYSGEYANAYQVGWIDKRAIEKEKTVVASTLFLPNGEQWIVYPENGPYEVGEIVSIEGVEGSWYTILGSREEDKIVIDLQTIGRKALLFEPDKGATITKTYA